MKLFALAITFFLVQSSFAQVIKGVVKASDNKPLEGATIFNLRTGLHTHSNEFGFFVMRNCQKGDSISVSYIAYSSIKFKVDNDSICIVLQPSSLQLSEVSIQSNVRHLTAVSNIDLQTNPVNSSQELLRKVPGLFIGQHAGGGKAEQIFLRGFDIDHGTDINISVDGMPVNMVSHAHGQGYADLHFLIPETINKIDFDKGPYHANKGNLATAGYVAFKTKEHFDNSSIGIEAGRFNTIKTTGLFGIVNNAKQAAWVAGEYLSTAGYFISPQNFHRANVMGKFTKYLSGNDKFSISASHFSSKWNASGQIPERSVANGSIDFFGAIDDTEGGKTSRSNINIQYIKHLTNNSFIKNTAFYSNYNFELYSNFTFFLKDPVNGDQIKQKEKRNIFGFESEINHNIFLGNNPLKLQAAVGLRADATNNSELSHTANRIATLQQIKLGNINENNFYSYVNAEYKLGKLLINPVIRMDYFKFEYLDKLSPVYTNPSQARAIVSPKLNFLFEQNKSLQYFLKLGKGFHSNDARVVVAQNGKQILPAAYGADLGLSFKPLPKLYFNAALWYLLLQQEFVYVGDEGVVEPSGKTERKGFDIAVRYQITKSLFFNGDFTYTHARSMQAVKGEDYIPLAPKITFVGGISLKNNIGLNGSIKTRYVGDRPANEDNSLVAEKYCVTDMNLNYQWKNFSIGFIAENIFNVRWKETQFATETQLKNEPSPVTEIHFTPGTPFNIKGQLVYRF